MERAAQLRANGADWPEVSERLGLQESTVRAYPAKYPPFGELVEWYRDQIWQEEVDELTRELPTEALRVLLDLLGDAEDVSDQALIWAAQTALDATGFATSRRTKARLKAQEEVTGEPGERVNLQDATDDLEDLTLEELTALYDELGDGP